MKVRCIGWIIVFNIFINMLIEWFIKKINIIIIGFVIVLLGFILVVRLLNMLVRILFDRFKVNKCIYERIFFSKLVVIL